MATITLQPICRTSPTPPPMVVQSTPPKSQSPITGQFASSPVAIPNKHLASPLSPLPVGQTPPVTPPQSPPSQEVQCTMSSRLYPPDNYPLIQDSPPLRAIDAAGVAATINHIATQPLPNADDVFPWAHGAHPENHLQIEFFNARKKAVKKVPTCVRFVTIVKVGGDLNSCKLKGAVIPEDVLQTGGQPRFVNLDPQNGFCVRNFHIQVGKFATLSDIIVYGGNDTGIEEVEEVAERISAAQIHFRQNSELKLPVYNTFVVTDPFSVFEELFPELVSIDSNQKLTGHVVEFYHWERSEMCTMSRASEISRNVFLGSTADAGLDPSHRFSQDEHWDIMIEASDAAHIPSSSSLRAISEALEHTNETQMLEFPSSGSVFPAPYETDGILETCRWIHSLASEDSYGAIKTDAEGDTQMTSPSAGRKILIHCTDGYTETSLLGLAYVMYAQGLPVHDAWLYLHGEKKRNFFAYAGDLSLLRTIQQRLLRASPNGRAMVSLSSPPPEPKWLSKMDGSLPSRILPYMYLGNLHHANNPALLQALGIRRVLSVGEFVSWTSEELNEWGKSRVLSVDNVQDNGIDSLAHVFNNCLDFIDEGRCNGEPTLVHCRVGVSRSATICIAEVMRSLGLSVPRAYCYVRARRLNVIIQPHCRFMYELLKFEEIQSYKENISVKREMEWTTVAREVAAMNRPYATR